MRVNLVRDGFGLNGIEIRLKELDCRKKEDDFHPKPLLIEVGMVSMWNWNDEMRLGSFDVLLLSFFFFLLLLLSKLVQ